jgi:hypothetical protein
MARRTPAPAPDWSWLAYARLGELYLEQQRWTDRPGRLLPGRRGNPCMPLRRSCRAAQSMPCWPANSARKRSQRWPGTRSASRCMATGGQGRDPLAHEAVRERLKSSLDTLATHYHAAFQQGDGSASEAAHWYQRWLEEFPSDAEAPSVISCWPNCILAMARLEAAAEAYAPWPMTMVTTRLPLKPDSRRSWRGVTWRRRPVTSCWSRTGRGRPGILRRISRGSACPEVELEAPSG